MIKTYRTSTRQTWQEQMWLVEDGEDYREYLCESCAQEFIEENSITQRNGQYGHYFGHADDNERLSYYSVPSWDQPELDYPEACRGYRYDAHKHTPVWLDHRLTQDGEDYTRERFGPSVQRLYRMEPK